MTMNDIAELLPYVIDGYKWAGLVVGASVFLSSEGTKRERALEAVVSAIAWPYVVYKKLAGKV